jgi:hypothetical protein
VNKKQIVASTSTANIRKPSSDRHLNLERVYLFSNVKVSCLPRHENIEVVFACFIQIKKRFKTMTRDRFPLLASGMEFNPFERWLSPNCQRPVFNFIRRGQISPPGVKLALRGELCPGVKLSPRDEDHLFTPLFF